MLKQQELTINNLETPVFLMNVPFSISSANPNNIWMEESPEPIDKQKAMNQFFSVYNYLASESCVFLLPSHEELQDLVYVANLGIIINHIPNRKIVVLSNFTSPPRVGEELVGKRFFEAMGYEVYMCPHKWEGEADLKHIRDNIYVGGFGMRSAKETYDWFEKTFGMKIIQLHMKDPYLYHLDCSLFPINKDNILLGSKNYSREEIGKLEEFMNVIDVKLDNCYSGACNNVRFFNTLLNGSNINELKAGTKEYKYEIKKNRFLEDIAVDFGMELVHFNISEYLKSGALLSCMIMHLNRESYKVDAF